MDDRMAVVVRKLKGLRPFPASSASTVFHMPMHFNSPFRRRSKLWPAYCQSLF